MSDARDPILSGIRRALGRGALPSDRRDALEQAVVAHNRNLVPARAQIDHPAQIALFVELARAAAATVTRVANSSDVPAAVAEFLASCNLPPRLRLAPDPALEALPWADRPLLKIDTGVAQPTDTASVTGAVAGIAETGTLMLASGPTGPTTLNFLPDNHVVVLWSDQVVGPFEDAWDRLRGRRPDGAMPRTVNFITGPSRSADIEQQLQMGAHGPRRLHIIVVDRNGGKPGQG